MLLIFILTLFSILKLDSKDELLRNKLFVQVLLTVKLSTLIVRVEECLHSSNFNVVNNNGIAIRTYFLITNVE